MARYVLLNRRAGKFTEQQKHASRSAVAMALTAMPAGTSIVADHNPQKDPLARRVVVFDASPDEVAKMQQGLAPDASADTIIEPLIERTLHYRTPPGMAPAALTLAAAAGTPYRVTVTGSGHPLAGIEVMFYVRTPGGTLAMPTAKTDAAGHAQITLPPGHVVAMVEPIPYSGHWITLAQAPPPGTTIACLPIAPAPADGSGWWHRVMGVDTALAKRGKGIKVGVIDTGCGPHPNLAHVQLAAVCIDGQILPGPGATDSAEHGTHTSGIIGAKSGHAGDYVGMAPDCELFHVRVFKGEAPGDGPSQADLINAIDILSRDKGCDLINMSLGGGPPSAAEEDAIRDAAERGTLCLCSAGNDGGAVNYPGAYSECAAVSAIGQLGWAPTGTFSAGNRPQQADKYGTNNLFLAAFSSYAVPGSGRTLACCGPGVGIVSTVPAHGGILAPYMEMDGTSMASPAACGLLAVVLANDAHYLALPRDISRTNAARAALATKCRALTLAAKYEGRGLPHV